MASSSSIKRAQAIKVCELCQENSIKWRCIDCDRCLCDKCKIIHLRVPVTSQHQIVTIGTPLQDVQKKIVTDNIPCKDHPQKMTCLFCRSCDSLVCLDCVSASHKKHNFDSIETALDEKLDNLQSLHDKIKDNIKCCESKITEIKSLATKYNTLFDASVTKIKQKEQELIDAIRRYSKKLQEKVESERSKVKSSLSKIKHEVDHTNQILEGQREEIEATLHSIQGSAIFKATIKREVLLFNSFDSLPNKVEQFIPQPESIKTIKELFGATYKVTISSTDVFPEMELDIIRTFTTDFSFLNQVITLDEKSAWISCFEDKGIKNIYIHDNSISTSITISKKSHAMAIIYKKDILVSDGVSSDIKLMKESGEIKSFLTVAPLSPWGVHVTKDNDVLVGVKEHGDKYLPTKQSQRAVIVFGMDKIQKHKYQYDVQGKQLFTFPKKITTNKNQVILVVDKTSKNTGRVVALSQLGKLRWTYEGHPKINASKIFDPRGMATTTEGHIVVSDKKNQVLQVLSENGDILTYKEVWKIGIIMPYGLDIDNEGRLWLGCGTSGKNTKAKLHIIKLTL